MMLLIVGGVNAASAWGDMYLVCGENNNWSTSDNNANFKFTWMSENNYKIIVPGSYVNSGNWYFRFRDTSSDTWTNIGPASSANDADVTNTTVTTDWKNSSKAFYITQNADAKWVSITISWSNGNNNWAVSGSYITDYNTIAIVSPNGWENTYVYTYVQESARDIPSSGVWPGTKITANNGIHIAEVPAGSKIIMNNGTGGEGNQYPSNGGFDATNNGVYDSNGLQTTTNVSVSSYGVATFCSNYPLDFTGIEDVKAYTIIRSDKATGALTKSQVTGKVAAGTGLYLEGTANASVDVPTTIYTESAGTNRLVGVTSDTNISQTDGDYTNYILTVNKVGGDVATPKFYKVNSKGNTVLANRAYLQIPTEQASRESFWFEDGVITAIESAKQEQSLNGVAYNLAGQRIAQPTKGLYIVNGKKIIMK
ncbi:hypothetical protein L6475_10995 [Prevotella sp. E9-3]|uniref:hypothetical protein n=1 Tax=Prevotella sp. E9-3 TaxID=2913621 RepID=UPI001EDABC45|nr:hypothetical protein [Prevotella sp. E9-3]UKK47736.1 hypothetical protein L6475_10995 [Prevotella sp. E9-3]